MPGAAVQASALHVSDFSRLDAGIGAAAAPLTMLLALAAMQARRVRLRHAHS